MRVVSVDRFRSGVQVLVVGSSACELGAALLPRCAGADFYSVRRKAHHPDFNSGAVFTGWAFFVGIAGLKIGLAMSRQMRKVRQHGALRCIMRIIMKTSASILLLAIPALGSRPIQPLTSVLGVSTRGK